MKTLKTLNVELKKVSHHSGPWGCMGVVALLQPLMLDPIFVLYLSKLML